MPFCSVVSSFFSAKLRKMGPTEEEAYQILQLPNNSSFETVLKSYKRLSLYWFPDKHDFSPTALENFRKISLAFVKLSCPERKICRSLTETEMFLVFHQIFFGNDKWSLFSAGQELSNDVTQSEATNGCDGIHEKDQEEVLDVEVTPSHEEIIMKQKKKTEKRKAERKIAASQLDEIASSQIDERKKERRKLEKELEKQKKDDDAAALSSAAKKHKGKKKCSKEVANSDGCKTQSNDSRCDCDDCLDCHNGSESDDIAKKYNRLLRDPYFPYRSEYDYYFRSDWDFGDESDCSGSDYDYSDSDDYPDERDYYNDLFEKLRIESFANAAVSKLADKNAHDLIAEEQKKKKQTERRKKQKKKRKERKKAEKEETENGNSTSLKTESTEMSSNHESSESEENIDLSSAFVVAVAKKKKMVNQLKVENLFQNSNEQINFGSQAEVCDSMHSVTEENVPHCASVNLAIRGNEMAVIGNYEAAVNFFTEAITLDSFNYRYYGNRSYCYERLGIYESALKDAEDAIFLFPNWAKGHFRKGKALVGMKRYSEAEKAFKKVVVLDPECEDVRSEILNTRVFHIMQNGFSKERAEAAVRRSEGVESALNVLLSEDFSEIDMNEDIIFVSDDNDSTDGDFVCAKTKPVKTKRATSVAPSAKKTVQKPKIFVGRLPEGCKSKDLQSLFAKYGTVKECDIVGGHAFVHMGKYEEAEKAIKALNNTYFMGSRLSVVHSTSKLHPEPGAPGRAMQNAAPRSSATKLCIGPNISATQQNNAVGGAERDECYFWRTTGCIAKSCRFKHIKENKGIDRKVLRSKIS